MTRVRPDRAHSWPPTGGRRAAVLLLTLASLMIPTRYAPAQDVTEPSLKAAFILNFARFTEWPPETLPPSAPFTACVLGETPVGQALVRTMQGRMIAGRPVHVNVAKAGTGLKTCHLLYVAGIPEPQVQQIVAATEGAPVLTIADDDSSRRLGAIAHLFIENGKLRFDLDHGRAKRARLHLSSKLLSLAARVHDSPAGGTR